MEAEGNKTENPNMIMTKNINLDKNIDKVKVRDMSHLLSNPKKKRRSLPSRAQILEVPNEKKLLFRKHQNKRYLKLKGRRVMRRSNAKRTRQ